MYLIHNYSTTRQDYKYVKIYTFKSREWLKRKNRPQLNLVIYVTPAPLERNPKIFTNLNIFHTRKMNCFPAIDPHIPDFT